MLHVCLISVRESIERAWRESGIEIPEVSYYGSDSNSEVRHGHSVSSGKKQPKLAFFKSYYVDDLAFILLSRRDAEIATSLLVKHFNRFGLKVHFGIRSENKSYGTRKFLDFFHAFVLLTIALVRKNAAWSPRP